MLLQRPLPSPTHSKAAVVAVYDYHVVGARIRGSCMGLVGGGAIALLVCFRGEAIGLTLMLTERNDSFSVVLQ